MVSKRNFFIYPGLDKIDVLLSKYKFYSSFFSIQKFISE